MISVIPKNNKISYPFSLLITYKVIKADRNLYTYVYNGHGVFTS